MAPQSKSDDLSSWWPKLVASNWVIMRIKIDTNNPICHHWLRFIEWRAHVSRSYALWSLNGNIELLSSLRESRFSTRNKLFRMRGLFFHPSASLVTEPTLTSCHISRSRMSAFCYNCFKVRRLLCRTSCKFILWDSTCLWIKSASVMKIKFTIL